MTSQTQQNVSLISGRLGYFLENWINIGASKTILEIIQGYNLPFIKLPTQSCVPMEPILSHQEQNLMHSAISDLLEKGAVIPCESVQGEFLSPIFLVPKPDGSMRFIFNLKRLNKFLQNSKFKMEDVRTSMKLMQSHCSMATADLKDAYYSVPIAKSDRKYLRFLWQGQCYEFQCLLFGISSAPRIFTKLLKPVFQSLRQRGYISVVYIDDILVIGQTYEECLNNITQTIDLLSHLGFIINFEKSKLQPSKIIKFLWFILNSENMTISLPTQKIFHIKTWCQKLISKNTVTIQHLSEFIGTLISATPAVPYGLLYTKRLERHKISALGRSNNNFKGKISLIPEGKSDIEWWIKNVGVYHKPIPHDAYCITICTDASKLGWGAYCDSSSTGGLWDRKQSKLHINHLELIAAYYGLRLYAKSCTESNILMRIDNTTAICCINKMGSVRYKHLHKVSRKIWKFCEERRIVVRATYISSKANVIADRESRNHFSETEWSLNPLDFKTVDSVFGPFDIDLFASCINTKCRLFISWRPDPYAINVDAFSICWENYKFYAFPPFNLITRVLQKIKHDQALGVVIVPKWESQPWFPVFRSMCVKNPITLGPNPNLLCFHDRQHPLNPTLTLMAGLLRGNPSYVED